MASGNRAAVIRRGTTRKGLDPRVGVRHMRTWQGNGSGLVEGAPNDRYLN